MVKCTQASSKLELSLNNPAKDQETAVIPNQPNQAGNGDDHTLDDFPEGGARAWAVTIGTAGIAFCTLGVINSFGCSSPPTNIRYGSPGMVPGQSAGGSDCIRNIMDRVHTGILRVWWSVCKEYYQFVLAQGILGGLSNGMTIFPAMSAGPQYFNKRRAAAMGIGIARSSLGGIVWPIVLTVKARLPPRKTQFFLWSSFKEPPYLYLVAAGFFGFLGVFTPLFYLPIYAYVQGAGVSLAFYLAAIFNAASFAGRVVASILADKLGRFNMFFSPVPQRSHISVSIYIFFPSSLLHQLPGLP
ncbi:monocarboxylate permease [Trichophyton equinum CBS 127.97]|uniref:Monocarboxylate permease n=1 Tax=Trichophyton equinum (strain ATCC MYA-4606 / CBS 127.97) TaxID=559882 RepID=F2PYD7_TRIEC|nr:monocarboxylate permease [Trichophyton equinum CBS 127.97]